MKKANNKQLYIIGGLAAAGLLYYFYSQKDAAVLPGGDTAAAAIPATTRANAVASFKNDITKMQWTPEYITRTPPAIAALNDMQFLSFMEYWNRYHITGKGGQAPTELMNVVQPIVNSLVAAKNWPG